MVRNKISKIKILGNVCSNKKPLLFEVAFLRTLPEAPPSGYNYEQAGIAYQKPEPEKINRDAAFKV